MAKPPPLTVDVPFNYPTSLIYVDESGSRASSEQFFVVGAVKVRESGRLMRAVHDIRDRHSYDAEFKFSQVTRGKLDLYQALIDELGNSDAHIAACVVDRATGADPFAGGKPSWLGHAKVISQLLVGCINRRELVSVLMDGIATPRGCALDDTVRGMVNKRLNSTSVITAACLDSRTNDGLQLADLVASAIAFSRREATDNYTRRPNAHKARVAARLASAFGLTSFDDVHNEAANIATFRSRPPRRLAVVGKITRQTG